jgi:hypothetical protein
MKLQPTKSEKDFIDLAVFSFLKKMKAQQCSVIRRGKVSIDRFQQIIELVISS